MVAGGDGLRAGRTAAPAGGDDEQVDAERVTREVGGDEAGNRDVARARGRLPGDAASATSTVAAAPSPNRTAVDRSSGSTTLVMVSAPTSRTVLAAPAAVRPVLTTSA